MRFTISRIVWQGWQHMTEMGLTAPKDASTLGLVFIQEQSRDETALTLCANRRHYPDPE